MFAGQMQRLHKKWADHTCAFKELQKKKKLYKTKTRHQSVSVGSKDENHLLKLNLSSKRRFSRKAGRYVDLQFWNLKTKV